MSGFKRWWENLSSREKTMLLLLLLVINAALFYQLNNSQFSDKPTAEINNVRQIPAATEKTTPAPQASALLPTPGNNLRDPFKPPAGLNVLPSTEQPLSNKVASSSTASASTDSASAKSTPVLPRLTGIVIGESGKRLAIIEYNGSSRYYGLYDEVGAYNIAAITSDSITLTGSSGSRQLTLRR